MTILSEAFACGGSYFFVLHCACWNYPPISPCKGLAPNALRPFFFSQNWKCSSPAKVLEAFTFGAFLNSKLAPWHFDIRKPATFESRMKKILICFSFSSGGGKSFFWPPVLPCRLGKKISSSNIWNHWKIQLVTGNCMLKCAETALLPIQRIGGVCLRPKMKDDILFISVIQAVLCHKTEALSVSLNAVWAQQLNYKTTMSDDNRGLIPAKGCLADFWWCSASGIAFWYLVSVNDFWVLSY